MRDVIQGREVVAAMHQLAVREAVGSLTEADLDAMREAGQRFRTAIEEGDIDAALRADADLHGVPVTVAGNRCVTSVLEQSGPVLARAIRPRFSSLDARTSAARHDDLIRLCAAGDAGQAASVVFDTWHSLPTPEE